MLVFSKHHCPKPLWGGYLSRQGLVCAIAILVLLTPEYSVARGFLVKVKAHCQLPELRTRDLISSHLYLLSNEVIQSFRGSPCVEYIEPNHKIELYGAPDDLARQQWWLKNKDGLDLNLAKSWQLSTGSQSVVVAVLDSGMAYEHPDLSANLWINEAEWNGLPSVDDDGNGFVDDLRGWSFYPDNNDIYDYRSHGTHVAGVIGAQGNNGIGIAGINWSVRIMALNVFPRYFEGRVSDAIRGIDYAVAQGAHIINASWGTTPDEITKDEFKSLKQAIIRAEQRGVLFVAAAGNSGASNENLGDVPASFGLSNIISVGSVDRYTRISDFSNYGATSVDVFAPGEEIYSSLPRNRYGYKSGTSMAAPMVSGLAALLLSHSPKLSHQELKSKIVESCVPVHSLEHLNRCKGIVSGESLLQGL